MSLPAWLTKNIDMFEKYVLVLFFGVLAFRLSMSMLKDFHVGNLLFLIDQGLILSFILLRRPAQDISRRPRDWAVAFLGTVLPMLVSPAASDPLLPSALCSILILTGMALHLSAKLSLRRSFGVVAANRGVMSGGAYRVVRHPMYAGYILTQIGFLLSAPAVANLIIIGSVWTMHVARIIAEERVLATDPSYRELMARTRFRLIPGLF